MKKELLVLSVSILTSCSMAGQSSSIVSSSNQSKSEDSSSVISSSVISSTSESSVISSESSAESEPSSQASSQTSFSRPSSEWSAPSFGSPQKPVSEDFLSLFDISQDFSISLNISEESASFMNEYQSKRAPSTYHSVYVPCDFTLTLKGKEYVYEDVGIRMKGNTSRRRFYEDEEILNPVHFKVSFKAVFDGEEYQSGPASEFKKTYSDAERKQRKDRNLFGLEKLDLKYVPRNGSNGDFLEPYAYNSFQNSGLLAPYSNIGELNLTCGEDSRDYTYEIVETVDKEFLKRRMSKANASGDLYKCVYGSMGKADLSRQDSVIKELDDNGYNFGGRDATGRKIGVEDDFNNYHPSYDLKTNDDGENSDFSSMVDYINAMWSCVYASAPQTSLENSLDVSYFLRFSAATYLFGNFDDQRYNANNYYIYFLPTNGKAYYIPYDWDWCLGLDSGRDMASRKPFDNKDSDGWNEVSNNVYSATILDVNNQKVSYSKEGYKKEYRRQIDELLEKGLLDYSFYESFVDSSCYECKSKAMVKDYMEKKTQVVENDNLYRD